MSAKLNLDLEESEEPSILSSDPNERKLARRLRIQKRSEALNKYISSILYSCVCKMTKANRQLFTLFTD